MANKDLPPDSPSAEKGPSGPSIWFGLWILLAGLLLLAERVGWLDQDIKWGIPLVLTMIGASIIHDYWRDSR